MGSPAGITALVGLAFLIVNVAPTAIVATPPCVSPEYLVAYASPVWSVRILSAHLPSAPMWYRDPQNRTFANLYEHVGAAVGADEPVTLFDRDGDGRMSANDAILIWDPEGDDRHLLFGFGEDPDRLGIQRSILLEDGHRYECMGSPSDPFWDVVFLGTASVSLMGIVLGWFMYRRHKRRRRMPF